ncbi:hypothetical protein Sjap_014985 [Stephania japonica]|uniref:C3HC-type domain-containing protein n=1 Tax=Stephania japonica TaxID=461633 RepID=A0AAP0IIE5_9MAGN
MADGDAEKRLHSVMDKLFHSPKPNQLRNRSAKSPTVAKRSGCSGIPRTNEPLLVADSCRVPKRSATAGAGSEIPLCKPWDRGDLVRRLNTFKSMTWFAKPKVVSAVNCARRGWINVDMDTIACEACGARLLFCIPPSWTQHQIEKTAAVFSLKLNDGHKMLCPWIDNACDETLSQFPPTPAPALVDSYYKRFSALLQLSALPVISSSSVDRMKSPQFEHFLEQFELPGVFYGTVQTSGVEPLGNEHEVISANLYYQAQKLISLCGWEPRVLPYMVDCGNPSIQRTDDAHSKDLSPPVNGQNAAIITLSKSGVDDAMEVNNDNTRRLQTCDPSSVVLECKLCGASIGLWAFSAVPRPLELVRLVESSKGDNEHNVSNSDGTIIDCTRASGTDYAVGENHFSGSEGLSPAVSTKKRHLDLSFSIAGGPPPAKQNYRARVSLPIISRYLRTGISSNLNLRDNNRHEDLAHLCNLSNTNSIQQNRDSSICAQVIESEAIGNGKGNEIDLFSRRENEKPGLNEESHDENVPSCATEVPPELVVDTVSEPINEYQARRDMNISQVSGSRNNTDEHDRSLEAATLDTDTSFQAADVLVTGSDTNGRVEDGFSNQDNSVMIMTEVSPQQLDKDILGNNMNSEDPTESMDHASSNVNSLDMITDVDATSLMELNADEYNHFKESSNDQGTLQEVDRVTPTVQPAINNEFGAAKRLGNDLRAMESDQVMTFDPIAQHRYFCPWIETNGGAACGWQLTLSALDRESDSSHHLPRKSPACSLEVDDPIASVRSLFASPPLKRKKTSSGST